MNKKKRERPRVTVDWNEESTIKLISAVQVQDLLWNPGHKNYKNRHLRETAWCEMSENTFNNEFDVDQLSAKWYNLRIQFKSYYMKNKQTNAGQQDGEKNRISWKYYNQMMFVIASEEQQSTLSNSNWSIPIVNKKGIASKLTRGPCRSKRIKSSISSVFDNPKITYLKEIEPVLVKGSYRSKRMKSSITSVSDNPKITVLKGIEPVLKKKVEEDSYQIFANFVAEELRKLQNPSLANKVQRNLTRYLMDCLDEAETDNLLKAQNTTATVQDQYQCNYKNYESEIKIEDQM